MLNNQNLKLDNEKDLYKPEIIIVPIKRKGRI